MWIICQHLHWEIAHYNPYLQCLLRKPKICPNWACYSAWQYPARAQSSLQVGHPPGSPPHLNSWPHRNFSLRALDSALGIPNRGCCMNVWCGGWWGPWKEEDWFCKASWKETRWKLINTWILWWGQEDRREKRHQGRVPVPIRAPSEEQKNHSPRCPWTSILWLKVCEWEQWRKSP